MLYPLVWARGWCMQVTSGYTQSHNAQCCPNLMLTGAIFKYLTGANWTHYHVTDTTGNIFESMFPNLNF